MALLIAAVLMKLAACRQGLHGTVSAGPAYYIYMIIDLEVAVADMERLWHNCFEVQMRSVYCRHFQGK